MAEEKVTDGELSAADWDRLSRTIGAFGAETMVKLQRLRVLIVGLRGVGIETAKNLILAGPRHVTLYDPEPVAIADLGSNFFLEAADVAATDAEGEEAEAPKSRAEAVRNKLQALNTMVQVDIVTELTEEIVGAMGCCVFTNTPKDQMIRWNDFCRSFQSEKVDARGTVHKEAAPIGFIAADVLGVTGYAFSDFGDKFTIRDANGVNPVVRVVQDITCEEQGVISLDTEGRRHDLPFYDAHAGVITLSDVDGMESIDDEARRTFGPNINTSGPWPVSEATQPARRQRRVNGETKMVEVQVTDPYRLKIGDTTRFTPYKGGGVVTQAKQPFTRRFASLAAKIMQPMHPQLGMLFTDGTKFGRPEQLHIALQGVWDFQVANGRFPAANSAEDTAACVEAAKAFNATMAGVRATLGWGAAMCVDEVDEEVAAKVARYAAVELQPLCAFFGGVAAQEVVKFTGKFSPLDQWVHIDAFEVLPTEAPADTAPLGCRYDGHIAIFGKAFQDMLGEQKTFMVGCGALGCEFIKDFALMGVACGEGGLITITDNDRIEVSNLSRQFLFREHNVGQAKSSAAGVAAKEMNPAINIESLEVLVHPGTESTFHAAFWQQQNFITNALDNVKAREYVDGRCVFFEKPLLESGTLGTQCNVQIILPHKTKSYTDYKDMDEGDHIPMCTLRNFPNLIEHCIEWSRSQFTDLFVAPPQQAQKLLADRDAFIAGIKAQCMEETDKSKRNNAVATNLPVLRTVKAMLQTAQGATFQQCVTQAYSLFTAGFVTRIQKLVAQYPADATNKDGSVFWSGAKRFPQVAVYDPADALAVYTAAAAAKEAGEQAGENPYACAMAYIVSTANLLAVSYGLVPLPEEQLLPGDSEWRNPLYIATILAEAAASEDGDATEGGEAAAAAAPAAGGETKGEEALEAADALELAALVEELASFELADITLAAADFEKDQDANFHIDFITAAANLRASNYRIKNATRHKCKMVAGKIIAAIATATASVTGLVMIELLKVLQDKPLEAFRDSSNTLGVNGYFFSEPSAAIKEEDGFDEEMQEPVKCHPPGFTKWDKTVVEIQRDTTVAGFLEAFTAATGGLVCTLLLHACSEEGDSDVSGLMLHDANAWSAGLKALYAEKANTPLVEWIATRYAGEDLIQPSTTFIQLKVSCENEDDEPCKIPPLLVKFPAAEE